MLEKPATPSRWRFAIIIAALIGMGFAVLILRHRAVPEAENRPVAAAAPTPTLYCDFYNFMRNATVVSFYFSADRSAPFNLNVSELFVVEPDGTKSEFGLPGSEQLPHWTYHLEEGHPIITSPDNETTIILYGVKQHTRGVFWVEAGLRSDAYRNLEGKCRQANFGESR